MRSAVSKIQTGIRLEPELCDRLKTQARMEGLSFNNYVEWILSKAVSTNYPKLSELKVSEEILSLGETLPHYTAEEIEADERLAYLLSK